MWTDYFHGIYLINLPECAERLEASKQELWKNFIYFRTVQPVKAEKPEVSIWLTYHDIISNALEKRKRRILIFEDDVQFEVCPTVTMTAVIPLLKKTDWDLFYFGPNTHQNFPPPVQPPLLQVYNAFGLHATGFSESGMLKLLKLLPSMSDKAIDVTIAEQIQPDGKCYCPFPLLATQRSGYSYVQKKYMDQSYIRERFDKHVQPILPQLKISHA